MLQAGIITASSSAWALPTILVDKKDGNLRLYVCVDYRKLNSVAQMDAYPISHINGLIDQLAILVHTRPCMELLASTCTL